MKNNIKSVIVLSAVCIVVAVLLAGTNVITSSVIEKNQAASSNKALLVVMPNGEGFEKLELSNYELPSTVTSAYSEKNGGFVIELTVAGYKSGMKIMCGIDNTGSVTGAVCLESSETLGYEKTYGEKTVGATLSTVDGIETVSGATKTTAGYKGAIKDALNSFVILNGGSVDIRTEAEILADNLNVALPSGEGDFEELFIVEALDGIDTVYKAKNSSGYVYVIGESFVGINAEGEITSQTDDAVRAKAEAAYAILSASVITELDVSAFELPSNILKVQKTESGNYVFELRAAGFGITGDKYYYPSGEYIYISLCASKDGKIISVKTTSQKESDGIGSVCQDKSFYGQFVGKDINTYGDIDSIAGATITTNGYKTAVKRALEAVAILEGAN